MGGLLRKLGRKLRHLGAKLLRSAALAVIGALLLIVLDAVFLKGARKPEQPPPE